MKKVLTLSLCLLCMSFAFADNVIKLNDETLIEDFTSISFDPSANGNIIVHFGESHSISVSMNILQVLPNANSTHGIEEMPTAKFARISQLVGDKLTIEGATIGDIIRVYNSNAILVTQCKASEESITLNLANCLKGTYLLSIGSTVIKFNKK